MHIATLYQILNRPWLMEATQAEVWAGIAEQILFHGASFNNLVPGRDGAHNRFMRVDANGNMTDTGELLVLDIKGPVMKSDYCGSPGMESLAQGIMAAENDNTISSIMLRIDSPGGTVDGTHNLARTVAASRKMGVAYVDGMMASAAYWIGSAAPEIISSDANAGHNAIIGSIGTMAQFVDMTQANAQRGIKVHTVYASQSTRKGQMARQVAAGDYSRIKAELDALNETFVASVQQHRGDKLRKRGENVFEGDTYNAQDAMRHGLIDKIGTWQYAVKRSIQISKTIKK